MTVRVQDVASYGSAVREDLSRRDRRRSERDLRQAIRADYEAVLRERTRIAREMHDGLLQNVTGIALQLRALLPRLRSASESSAIELERILALAERTSTEARLAVVDMRHFTGSNDLVNALRATADRTLEGSALALSVSVRGTARTMPPRACDAAISIVQHAVTNVVRHARAQNVQLTMVFGSRRLRVSIRDDGCGFIRNPSTNADTHFGLIGMHERATEVGARLRVRSLLGRGTRVSVLVPYLTG